MTGVFPPACSNLRRSVVGTRRARDETARSENAAPKEDHSIPYKSTCSGVVSEAPQVLIIFLATLTSPELENNVIYRANICWFRAEESRWTNLCLTLHTKRTPKSFYLFYLVKVRMQEDRGINMPAYVHTTQPSILQSTAGLKRWMIVPHVVMNCTLAVAVPCPG